MNRSMRTRHVLPDSPEASSALLYEALSAAGSLLWAYDLSLGQFEFRGDAQSLGLTPFHDVMTLETLAPLLAGGEAERLDTVLRALDVLTSIDLPGDDDVQCLLRLKDRRLVYLKGRRVARGLALGTLTDLSRDMRHAASNGGGQPGAGLDLEDSHIDSLTGLYSRSGFLPAVRTLLARPGDYDFVVCDLNRFRRLNEALGHERADLVLSLLAQRLRDAFPGCAVLARLGEDEFAVLTQRGFPRVSERMRNALERTISVAGFDIHPTFSMGAVAVEGGEAALDGGELLRRAEMAVEVAKSRGAGGVAAYKRDLESDGLTRLALEAELRKAFISGEIHAWYQPIVDLETGVIAGFEALARWVHPKRGVIPPDNFLSATRDLGMMTDLGTIIMNATVMTLGKWLKSYRLPEGFFISVNLSAPEIERLHLVEDVSRLIREHDLPVKALKLEVTESDVMRDPAASARVLEDLRDAGAGIALDDFGTGFSSLSYLAKLPFDTLKIDRSFVSTLGKEESSEKIVRAILTLGRDLGLDVVAEGVEDMALASQLYGLGCGLGQGYGFARALKAQDAEAFLVASLAQADASGITRRA
ncbi:bifunctional diguanylate cyclase/phosphodiesterase [Asticcacaulis sp. EMRT-3]|uniref:putative bifunctional diguanylate cyclase/phosphodiesterase n=1 Tax=Asticcacaulis sp. EMRT-3 TaxID=3040349 RepID=UPI0024AFD79F|nr:bifunctional diguanylate cyclase/phosphodiesterase [Asticcacaulis sp. EMRT-3]MDI7774805.1 bifunctional diguanylate cyclase/phosphodiesterase [Asticcacaulis sp. EMRT-3]